jgi:hypothetical protein
MNNPIVCNSCAASPSANPIIRKAKSKTITMIEMILTQNEQTILSTIFIPLLYGISVKKIKEFCIR